MKRGCGCGFWAVLFVALFAYFTFRGDPAPTTPDSGGASTSSTALITRAQLGDDWPLTVDQAVLGHDARDGVTLTINGTVYGVNGIARGELLRPEAGDGQKRYQDFNASGYWAENPGGPGPKKDIGPIIDRGRALPFGSE